jgi:hypothetical protein
LPWLSASITLSQEAFKLLYLSEISEEGKQLSSEDLRLSTGVKWRWWS